MELVNIYSTGLTYDFQRYDDKDNALIVSSFANTEMDPNLDSIELTVYGESGEFLDYNPTINTFKVAQGNVNSVTGFYTKLELDPKADVNNLGLTRGRVNAQYNFLKPLFNSSNTTKYWIREISPSGTELKLSSQNLSNEQIRTGFTDFQAYVSTKNYYVDFYLNFNENRLIIANNAAISEEDGEVYLLIKLYDPLPEDFETKDTLWLCDKFADSVVYTIDTQITEVVAADANALRGPNNRIAVREKVGQTTPYYSYSSLFSSTVSSSLQQILSYYQDKAIEINVDYSNFSNFIHFSSATERINNFVYKLGLIEQYQSEISETSTFSSMSSATLTLVSQSNVLAQQNIDSIINKFDTYEYYLYYLSESFAWPKSNSAKPYQLYSVTSSEALTWLGSENTLPTANSASILYSASFYDNTNKDRLANAIPQYLLDDSNNEPYVTFIDMVGQHFDNIWLYYKDLSNRYASFNNPSLGLSKDVVADALRGFGFNLYTNTSISDNLYYTLFGINQDGSLLPPTGSEKIAIYVTSSIDTLSPTELNSEVYKRLYHNITYLLKTKGTQRGVKALVACYGIPENILDVKEFGGNNRYTGSGIYEVNNQKINYFTQSAELSTPLLSPYTTIQQYNTNYRLNTLNIEVGFSPSDQINRNFVSSSGFVSIDQLIGAPEHQYLQYYPDLKIARDNYFASYNYPHSVWEYIRIIKYYNNSLFKTIKDFVPARSNAAAGIVIKSHVLERNKYARTEPSMSFDNNLSESIDMVSIAGSAPGAVVGSTQYVENVITPLGFASFDYEEDKAKITGRLSGSFVQVTNGEAFDQSDFSTTASGSVEVDFSANYQNFTTANRSKKFFELDYAYSQNTPVNFNLITQSINNAIINNFNTYNNIYSPYADIQDYNYSTRAFTDARYYGSRTRSLLYNKYTPASLTYEGDSSYGKTAAIDLNVRKIGLFTRIESSSFLPKRNNISFKYLVDEFGNLTELNQLNSNWEEVQNTFKTSDISTVALFDNKKFSNQKSTDGEKLVFDSGYLYSPVLYFSGSCPNTIYFENLGNPSALLVTANNLSSSYFVSGSGTLGYPVVGGVGGAILNLFNHETSDIDDVYTPGTPATYSIAETGQYKLYAELGLSMTASVDTFSTWSLEVYSGSTVLASSSANINSVSAISGTISDAYSRNEDTISPDAGPFTVNRIVYAGSNTILPPSTWYRYDAVRTVWNSDCDSPTITDSKNLYSISASLIGIEQCPGGRGGVYSFNEAFIFPPDFELPTQGGQAFQNFVIDKGYSNEDYLPLLENQQISLRLVLNGINQSNYTASVTQGNLSISALSQTTGYSSLVCSPGDRFITAQSGSNVFTFNDGLSSFYNSGFIFVPNPLTGSFNSLYPVYGDVDYNFNLNVFSILVLKLSDNTDLEFRIISIDTSGNNVSFNVDKIISNQVAAELSSGTIKRVLLLTRVEDETNAYIVYQKRDGLTSYGFLIPSNLAEDVLKNIDSITAEVKIKLLADQQGSVI